MFNKDIRISNKPFLFKDFSKQNIDFINQFITSFGDLKNWSVIKRKFQLNTKLHYKQIKDTLKAYFC